MSPSPFYLYSGDTVVGSYGKVELRPSTGRNLANGKIVERHFYIVLWDGRQVGIKSKTFSAPVQWTSKIPKEIQDHVVSEVKELLGDSSASGSMKGLWDHEVEPKTKPEGDGLDDIFN